MAGTSCDWHGVIVNTDKCVPVTSGLSIPIDVGSLLIATLRDDVVLDVETKILKNAFVAIMNDGR